MIFNNYNQIRKLRIESHQRAQIFVSFESLPANWLKLKKKLEKIAILRKKN